MSYVNVQERRLPFVLRYIGDLVAYRHLCWNLVSSDLRARFRRTHLGILWAILQPLLFALLIATIWGGIRNRDHYLEFALYVFSGFVLFDFFSATVNSGQDALMSAGDFLKQARIPFFIFQARVVLTACVIFICATLGVFAFQLITGQVPPLGPHLALLAAFLPMMILFLLPLSVIMSIIGTLFRDVKHIAGLAVQAMMFMSPVILPREFLEAPHLQAMQYINPMVPLLDMFRAPILYGNYWLMQDVLVVLIWTAALWALAIIMSINVGRKLVFAV